MTRTALRTATSSPSMRPRSLCAHGQWRMAVRSLCCGRVSWSPTCSTHPELPKHPLQFIDQIAQASLSRVDLPGIGLGGPRIPEGNRPVVRVPGHPLGHLNLMPVEHAARVMVRLASGKPSGQVDTYHVVHDHDVPTTTMTAAMEQLVPIRVKLVEKRPRDPSPLETVADLYPGFTPYLSHRRRFDDTRVRTLLGPMLSGIRVDLDYLLVGVRSKKQTTASSSRW